MIGECSLEIECGTQEKDLLVAELWEEGSTGIVELTESHLRAFFEDGADRTVLAERFHASGWKLEEQQDWVAMSRAGFEPLLVGERFFLVPAWRNDPAPEGRFRVAVNPGMAFGTGRHETTQMRLAALESYVQPGISVLDVGTGAGILAQAAVLLGAGSVWACDNDPDAVQIAQAIAGSNLFLGSVDAVRSGSAGVIVANISPEAIIRLAPDLMRSLRPGGSLLVSGFERHEATAVQSELEAHGGTILESRHKNSWALLIAR